MPHRDPQIAGATSVGSWDWDVVADRITADPTFARLYGVDPGDAQRGTPLERFFGGIHPDDLPRVQAEIAEALATGAPFESDYRLRQPDGRARWVAARGQAQLDDQGRAIRFPGISFDIDARKTAELRLQALVELNDRLRDPGDPDDLAYAAVEILGRLFDVSRCGYGNIDPEAETIVATRPYCAPGVDPLPDLLHFRDYGSYIEDLKRGETVAIGNAYDDPRTRDTAEGLKGLAALSFVNMPITERGDFVALLYLNNAVPRPWLPDEIAFIRDVAERTRDATERRRVERQLGALTASLEQQVEERTHALMVAEAHLRQAQKMEAVGQLTGGLAHDFNNMLTGISGAIEMMQVRVAQGRIGDLDRYATAALGATRRAAALTHRLLAFSRRQTLDPKPTDVNRLIADLSDLIQRTAGPGIDLEVVGAAGLWPAMVDPNQLENAILNLCINARDAMPDGGRITIETANRWLDQRSARERDLEPGQYLSVCVTDTGTGMTPEVQARAFDPFYTTKPMGEGTGLGLSMIYGFARQSGGQVRIYSELGQGTTMCIYLPRHYGDSDAADEDALETPLAAPGTDGRCAVMVVDDEPTIRMLVVEILEDMGHIVLEAGDGPSALRLLGTGAHVDLLITDVGLPGQMNGRQVADAAIELLPQLKVLFITGYAENAVIGNGPLGPNMALMTKPFAMDIIADRIRTILAG